VIQERQTAVYCIDHNSLKMREPLLRVQRG